LYLIFAITGSREITSEKKSVAPIFASEFANSFLGSSACPGTHWKLRDTREEKKLERAQIFQKDFGWRNVEAVKIRTSPIGSQLRKGPIVSGMS